MKVQYRCGQCGGLFDGSNVKYTVNITKGESLSIGKAYETTIICKECKAKLFPRKQPVIEGWKFGLSVRESFMIVAVVAGYSNKEIAEYFNLTDDDAAHCISSIIEKLGVSTFLPVRDW